MRRKAAIAVSAMLLAAQLGRPAGAQEPALEELSAIATLLDNNDVAGLRSYLETNPELLEGDTQLAILLRRFLVESEDIVAYLGFEPDLGETLQALQAPLEEGSDPGDGPEEPAEPPDDPGDGGIY